MLIQWWSFLCCLCWNLYKGSQSLECHGLSVKPQEIPVFISFWITSGKTVFKASHQGSKICCRVVYMLNQFCYQFVKLFLMITFFLIVLTSRSMLVLLRTHVLLILEVTNTCHLRYFLCSESFSLLVSSQETKKKFWHMYSLIILKTAASLNICSLFLSYRI